MEDFVLFGTKEEGVEYRERPGAYGIAIHEGSILIEKARLGYFLPGGGIENNETTEEALVREFLEETGYELLSYLPLGKAIEYVHVPHKNLRLKKVAYFYTVELGAKGEPTYTDGHIFPVEWTPVNEVKALMHLESQWWAIQQALKI